MGAGDIFTEDFSIAPYWWGEAPPEAADGEALPGRVDVAVVGGADALSRFPYLGFAALRNSSPERCRPFDLHRKGLNLGEGAAIMVLEREDNARRRGAAILARLVAYASASDP